MDPKDIIIVNKNKYKVNNLLVEYKKNIYMSPELFFKLKHIKSNIELSNIFSIGLILLRIVLLLKE